MVVFKNRYLLLELFLDPNHETTGSDPIIITQYNISKAIRDSLLANFGECGLASSLGSFQVKYVNPITKTCIIRISREEYTKVWSSATMVKSIGNCSVLFNLLDLSGSIRACKARALSYEEKKFELHKLLVGGGVSDEDEQHMLNCLEKIKILEP